MEKLGIAKEDLLNELKSEYRLLKEKEARLVKEGSGTLPVQSELGKVKAKIDELEKEG